MLDYQTAVPGLKLRQHILILLFLFACSGKASAKITHCHFIVNPNSNHGHAAQVWENEILPLLAEFFTPEGTMNEAAALDKPVYTVDITKTQGEGTGLANQAFGAWQNNHPQQDDQLLIVAVGGDGTVHEVAQPFAGNQQVVFGILPTGTGNDQARTLGLTDLSWRELLETLTCGQPVQTGAYQINATRRGEPESSQNVYAVNEFDFGFTEAASRMKQKQKQKHDTGTRTSNLLRIPKGLVYPLATTLLPQVWRAPQVRLSVDGTAISGGAGSFLASIGPTVDRTRLLPGMAPGNERGQFTHSAMDWGFLTLVQMLCPLTCHCIRSQPQTFTEIAINHLDDQPPLPLQIDGEQLWETPFTATWRTDLYTFMCPRRK